MDLVGKLNLYLENLLPGIVILGGLLLMIPASSYTTQVRAELIKNEFIQTILFLAAAYLIGLISAVLSRWLIDYLSEKLPRPMLLSMLSHKSYNVLKQQLISYNKQLSLPIVQQNDERKFWKPQVRLAWNQAYRATLSELTRSGPEKGILEVQRRREQGRLVRNLFFPIAVSSLVVTRHVIPIDNVGVLGLLMVLILIGSVFLYAYAEYFNFAEASLHLREKPDEDTNHRV